MRLYLLSTGMVNCFIFVTYKKKKNGKGGQGLKDEGNCRVGK